MRPVCLFVLIFTSLAASRTALHAQEPAAEEAGDLLDTDLADQLPRIPPRSLDEALKSFQLENGFRIEAVAAEPQVSDPVAITFDEDGRMFVVEMRGYSEDGEKKLGVVRLLEDRDNDGRFETSTVFLDGLSWPTAIICWRGGVLVGAAPDIYYCRDNDGDGQADVKETVFTGFHRTNVQGLLNSFCWSLDNRIYGATSGSGATVTAVRHPQSEPLSLRRRDFIIEPHSMSIAAASGGGQHGQSFDNFGRRFVCSNSNHLQMMMYEDRYVARNRHLKAPAANVNIAADGPQAPVFRTSPVEPWRVARTRLRVKGIVPGPIEGGGKPAGYFTAATGVTIYRGDAFPPLYRGSAFVADCGSNLVHRKVIEAAGVGAVAKRTADGTEFLTSNDIWFRPVQMTNSPDGTLYVLDMSREVIEHPKSLPPVIKKHLDLTSGRERGRIYRVVPNDFRQPPPIRLGELTGDELAKTLEHTNGWHRDTAARLIYERQDRTLAPALERLASTSQHPEARIRSLYALDGLQALSGDVLLSRLNDPHPRVREHAVRLAESHAADSPRVRNRLLALADDPDLRVRYQIAFSLGEFRGPGRVEALVKILRQDLDNRWIRLAVLSSLSEGAAAAFALLASEKSVLDDKDGQAVLASLAGQIAAQGRQYETAIALDRMATLADGHPTVFGQIVQSMAAAVVDNAALRKQLSEIAAGDAGQVLNHLISDAKRTALHEKRAVAERCEAVRALRVADFADVQDAFGKLIVPSQPDAVQVVALATLREFDDPAATALVIERFSSLSPSIRGEALESLLSNKQRAMALLDEIAAGRFAASNVGAGHRRLLAEHPDREIRSRATKMFGDESLFSPRHAVIRRYQAALDLEGDVARGRIVFRKNCAACHRLENHGHELGKDLKSIGDQGAAAILTNVLDPNRAVDPAYLNYTAVTEEGRVYSGVIVAETAASLTLKRANGATDTLARHEIDELKSSGQSIMPEGLEKEIGLQEMADLIAYLLSN